MQAAAAAEALKETLVDAKEAALRKVAKDKNNKKKCP